MYLYKTDNFFHINLYLKSVSKVALLHRFYCTIFESAHEKRDLVLFQFVVLHLCAGSPEPSLVTYMISTGTLFSCVGSFMANVLKFRTPEFLTKWRTQNSADTDQTGPEGAVWSWYSWPLCLIQTTLFTPTLDTTAKFVIKTIWLSWNHHVFVTISHKLCKNIVFNSFRNLFWIFVRIATDQTGPEGAVWLWYS